MVDSWNVTKTIVYQTEEKSKCPWISALSANTSHNLQSTNQVPEPQQAGRNCVRAFFVLFVIVFVSLFCYFPTHRHLYTHTNTKTSQFFFCCLLLFSFLFFVLLPFAAVCFVNYSLLYCCLTVFSFVFFSFGTCIDFVFFGVSIFWHLDSVRQTDLVSLRSVRAACLRLVFFSFFFLFFFVKHLHITHTHNHTHSEVLTDRPEELWREFWQTLSAASHLCYIFLLRICFLFFTVFISFFLRLGVIFSVLFLLFSFDFSIT